MEVRKQTVNATVLVVGALLLAACGTNKTESPGGSAAGGSCDTSKGTLVVGVIAPQTGGLSAMGLGIKNSAQLAVDQANEKCTVKGYKLALSTEDDQALAQIGAQAAGKLASDPNVVGVVGTLNSSVAQSVQPVLAQKKIMMISPANTNPTLTRGQNYSDAPKRQFDNYFRVCTIDSQQGPFGAQYLVKTAGKKKIATISDGKTYGDGLVAEFAKEATKDGATVLPKEQVGEKDTDFSGVIAKIKALAPDAVYYGGEYPIAGPLSKQMGDAGMKVPVMGGDGIFDQKFVDLGGRQGDLATSVGAPAETLDTAKAFIDAYQKKGYKDGYSAYGSFAYDAATVIISSLAKAVGSGSWSDAKRADMITAANSYNAPGANGTVAFDQFGDSTNKLLTVYQVSAGKWVAAKTGTVQQ